MQYVGDIIRARFIERFLPKGQGKCLDAGAGAGIYKSLVLSKGYEYVGIDVKPRSQDVVYGDITSIPFPDNYFEAVLCVDILEHVEKDYIAIKEMFRVLKPKGVLVLHTPDSRQTHILADFPENPSHLRAGYTDMELKGLLGHADFCKVEVHPTFNVLEAIAWELCNLSCIDETMIRRLIDFDLQKFKNLAWIVTARKRASPKP